MVNLKYIFILLLLLSIAAASPDELCGHVAYVVDGDTFHLITTNGSEIVVRLADVDAPETRGPKACQAGKDASNFTKSWLHKGTEVCLDIDDNTGRDRYDRWVAVCYLAGKNFNQMLVDAGHAVVKDFKNNEFDPRTWA